MQRIPSRGVALYGYDGHHFIGASIDTEGKLHIRNYVWNTNTLAWEAATGGGGTPSSNVTVDNFPATQPISVISLPLPSGAATEATLAALVVDKPTKATRADWASSTVFYKGWAPPGVSPSSAYWAVSKRTIDANGGYVELWADGNNDEDNVWDNRVSLSYA